MHTESIHGMYDDHFGYLVENWLYYMVGMNEMVVGCKRRSFQPQHALRVLVDHVAYRDSRGNLEEVGRQALV